MSSLLASVLVSPSAAQSCSFAPVRAQIDAILDRDAALGAKFRQEFNEGADSMAVLESLVSEEMRAQVDICRFEAAEYLTKRGFPPPH